MSLERLKKRKAKDDPARPRLVCVLALLDEYERMGKDERKSEFPKFDGRLDAVADDMAASVGEVMSSVAFWGGRKGVHSVSTAQELSSFGWTEVRHPYRRGADGTNAPCVKKDTKEVWGSAGTATASRLRT